MISAVGGIGGNFALPLDAGASGDAYALGLYINSGFGAGANIADHIQFSFGGADNFTADERSDEPGIARVEAAVAGDRIDLPQRGSTLRTQNVPSGFARHSD